MKNLTHTLLIVLLSIIAISTAVWADDNQADNDKPFIKLGIIGLDTSHAIAFTKLMNSPSPDDKYAGCRVVVAYPKGSPDIESSVVRVPKYTKQIQELGVKIVPSIEELLKQVDGVLLETNDGRPHLEQIRPCLKAGKPVFIDKPIAGSLKDAVTIFKEAKEAGVPIFSSSSLRYMSIGVRDGAIGKVIGCDAYSPCHLEKTHPDFFWYGIHGVETLFAAMGTGCESVTRVSSEGTDVAIGKWSDGRIGSFRGMRSGKSGYGGTVFGTKGIKTLDRYQGYQPLVAEIVKFFRTKQVPVDPRETLEIYAFMEAADESKRQGGVPIKIADVFKKAGSE